MIRNVRICSLLIMLEVLLVMCWMGSPSYAQNPDKWVWEVTPYYWMSDIEGDANVQGTPIPVDVSFDDIEDNIDTGVLLSIRTMKPTSNWGYLFGVIYLNLDGEQTFTEATVTSDLTMSIWELGVTYSPKTDAQVREALASGSRAMWFSWLGGVRYFSQSIDLSASTGESGSADDSWAEPMVGFMGGVPLGRKLLLALRGDVGGFNVGESEFTWNALVDFRYQLSSRQTLNLGYKWLSMDALEDGNDGADITFKGPVFGISNRF